MQEAYVNIGGIPTHIFTWGRWIEESLGDDVKEIAICITGNPGLAGFYTEFLGSLHNHLNKMPVWVIGHLGHDDPPSGSIREVPRLKGNEALFDLDGQVRHKLEFIEKFVPAGVKIHLIGHSIGAWMILQLLEHNSIRDRIKHCYMLFPTIERMVDSPNGWLFTKIALPLYSFLGFFITLFSQLPNVLRIIFLQLYFWLANIPNYFLGTALKYSKPAVMQKVVFLAKDEMARVCKLPVEVLDEHQDLLTLYYGSTDGWVPIQYFTQLKERYPKIDARLDTAKIDHAFVLRHAQAMARIVEGMIKPHSTFYNSN